MRIFVTGGAGYIGSHTVIELIRAGHDVVVADNLHNSSPVAMQRVAQIVGREVPFYQALALRELGRADEATTTLRTLRDFCRKTLGGADEQPDFFAKFSESQADDTKQAVFGRLLQKVNRELGDD